MIHLKNNEGNAFRNLRWNLKNVKKNKKTKQFYRKAAAMHVYMLEK